MFLLTCSFGISFNYIFSVAAETPEKGEKRGSLEVGSGKAEVGKTRTEL